MNSPDHVALIRRIAARIRNYGGKPRPGGVRDEIACAIEREFLLSATRVVPAGEMREAALAAIEQAMEEGR